MDQFSECSVVTGFWLRWGQTEWMKEGRNEWTKLVQNGRRKERTAPCSRVETRTWTPSGIVCVQGLTGGAFFWLLWVWMWWNTRPSVSAGAVTRASFTEPCCPGTPAQAQRKTLSLGFRLQFGKSPYFISSRIVPPHPCRVLAGQLPFLLQGWPQQNKYCCLTPGPSSGTASMVLKPFCTRDHTPSSPTGVTVPTPLVCSVSCVPPSFCLWLTCFPVCMFECGVNGIVLQCGPFCSRLFAFNLWLV